MSEATKVLILEDRLEYHEFLPRVLQRKTGLNPIMAKNQEEFLEALRSGPIDFGFFDDEVPRQGQSSPQRLFHENLMFAYENNPDMRVFYIGGNPTNRIVLPQEPKFEGYITKPMVSRVIPAVLLSDQEAIAQYVKPYR